MHRALGVHGEERARALRRFGIADVDVGRVFDDQNALVRGDVQNRAPALGAEREAGRIVAVRHRVVEGHEAALGARPADRLAELVRARAFVVHVNAEHARVSAQRCPGEESSVGGRVGDVGDGPPGALEDRADQVDAAGGADGGHQLAGVDGHAPVAAVDGGEGFPRACRP